MKKKKRSKVIKKAQFKKTAKPIVDKKEEGSGGDEVIEITDQEMMLKIIPDANP